MRWLTTAQRPEDADFFAQTCSRIMRPNSTSGKATLVFSGSAARTRFELHSKLGHPACDLLRVDLIGLGLAAVNRFHGQRVSQDEGGHVLVAQIGETVPVKQALARHAQLFAIGFDHL